MARRHPPAGFWRIAAWTGTAAWAAACSGGAGERRPDGRTDAPGRAVDAVEAGVPDEASGVDATSWPTVEATVPPPPPPREAGDGFRSFRGGRFRAGRARGRAPAAPGIRWELDVGGPVRAQPVLAPDGSILAATLAGTLTAVGPDGVKRWSFDAGDRIYSTPFVTEEGRVVFGADTDSLYALDAGGRPDWTLLPSEDTEKRELHDVDTAPLIAGGVGWVGAGVYVYGFDLRGAVRWRTATGGKVYSSPALLPDGTVLAGSQDDFLWALRPGGALRWKYPTAGDVDSTPAVDEVRERIYVGSDDGKVHAVTFEGRPVWAAEVGGFVRSGVAVDADGFVYATTFGPTARLAALDPDTGGLRWTVEAGTGPTAEYGVRSSPVVDRDGVVLFGAPGGTVRAVSREGRTLWTLAVPDDVDGGPILADDGTVYFGCDDGRLRAAGDPLPGAGGDGGGDGSEASFEAGAPGF